MKKEHFDEMDTDGKKYKFTFDKTWVVGKCFFKPREWGPYTKIGELSTEGIKFVESIVHNQPTIHWADYVKPEERRLRKGVLR